MKVGFTGSRRGLTEAQRNALRLELVSLVGVSEFHHGDCVGADEQAHNLVRILRPFCTIVLHPCDINEMRAFCRADKTYAAKKPLDRNMAIVREVDVLIACSGESTEKRRSGTWATVRYAAKMQRKTILILPDGSCIHRV